MDRLFKTFEDRVPAEADLVTYWIEKAQTQSRSKRVRRSGFVTTQAIRRGASQKVIERATKAGPIFEAWSNVEWIVDAADVRVSLICFGEVQKNEPIVLDGRRVTKIFSDLTGDGIDLTKVARLSENSNTCWQGTIKVGDFDIGYLLAKELLLSPLNPNGCPNSDMIRPWLNGSGITDRNPDKWIVDFGCEMIESEAALYEKPFQYITSRVKPFRSTVNREVHRRNWWRHGEARPGLRRAVAPLSRFIATPRVSKHRLFIWADRSIIPDSRISVISRDDDTTFGILSSHFHELWSIRLGGRHGIGNDPQYTPSSGFETFPFPAGLTPDIPAARYADDPRAKRIAEAAKRLDDLREAWLNPPDLVRREPEVVPGFPDRLVPKGDKAAAELKKRTLTNLYNARPQWLADAHKALDDAVAAAYGWPADLADDEILARLLALNLERAAAQGAAPAAKAADEDAAEAESPEEDDGKRRRATPARNRRKPGKT